MRTEAESERHPKHLDTPSLAALSSHSEGDCCIIPLYAAPWSSSACVDAGPLPMPMCPTHWLLLPLRQQSPGSSSSSASTSMLACCISRPAVNLSRCSLMRWR